MDDKDKIIYGKNPGLMGLKVILWGEISDCSGCIAEPRNSISGLSDLAFEWKQGQS